MEHAPSDDTLLLVWTLLRQLVSSPAAILLILVLNSLAFYLERSPFFPSKYIASVCVPLGALLYWAYSNPSTVSPTFPHPVVILVSNGFIVSIFAIYVLHGQVVKRLFFAEPKTSTPPPSTP